MFARNPGCTESIGHCPRRKEGGLQAKDVAARGTSKEALVLGRHELVAPPRLVFSGTGVVKFRLQSTMEPGDRGMGKEGGEFVKQKLCCAGRLVSQPSSEGAVFLNWSRPRIGQSMQQPPARVGIRSLSQ